MCSVYQRRNQRLISGLIFKFLSSTFTEHIIILKNYILTFLLIFLLFDHAVLISFLFLSRLFHLYMLHRKSILVFYYDALATVSLNHWSILYKFSQF